MNWPPFLSKVGLSTKLLLIVVGVSLIGVLLSSALMLTLEREEAIRDAEAANTRLSDGIVTGLQYPVANGDWQTVDRLVQATMAKGGLEAILVLDPEGTVRSSSGRTEIGQQLVKEDPQCTFCHSHSLKTAPGNMTTMYASPAGHVTLLNVNVIHHPSPCPTCDPSEPGVAGILMIATPLTDLNRHLTGGLWRVSLAALVTFVLSVALTIIGARKLIIRPVAELARGAKEIGGGNLDYAVSVETQDELGHLAQAFETMRQQLRASRTKSERHTRELTLLAQVALEANQSANLQQMLDLTLNTVIGTLEMQTGLIHLLDRDSGQFVPRASRGLTDLQCQEIEQRRKGLGWDRGWQGGHSDDVFFVADMGADNRFQGLWENLRYRSFVSIPLRAGTLVVGTMALTTAPGQPLGERELKVLKTVGNEIGIAIENARLLEETRRAAQEATILYQLGMNITASLQVDQVMNAVAEGARQLLGADIGAVGLVDEERAQMLVKSTAGTRTNALNGLRIPMSKGRPLGFLATDEPIAIESYGADVVAPHGLDPMKAEGVASILAVPLRHGERLVGLITVMTRQRRRFTKEESRLLARLAHHVVVAVENAELYREVRNVAALEERDRLARELHDNLAQALGYLKLKSGFVENLLAQGQTGEARTSLGELGQIAGAAYTDVREAIFSLRAIVSSEVRLVPALREYLAEYRAHYDLETELVIDDESLTHFPIEVEIQAIRIIQEALANARKHARAKHVWVRFERDRESPRITIEDDGCGFDAEQVHQNGRQHCGLQIMQERLHSIQGNLVIDSHPSHGTRIIMQMPHGSETK